MPGGGGEQVPAAGAWRGMQMSMGTSATMWLYLNSYTLTFHATAGAQPVARRCQVAAANRCW